MNLEIETKLSVPSGFALPIDDFRELGMQMSDVAFKSTRTVYFDTPNLDLAACGAAVRLRSEIDSEKDVVWTLKFSSPQTSSVISRFELEVYGDSEHFPSGFGGALRVFGASDELRPIATLLANRSSIWFVENDGSRVVEIDDDVVSIQGDCRKSHTFREVEVEVTDPGYRQFSERIVDILLIRGGCYAESSSKLEQALAVTMDVDRVTKVLERYPKRSLVQLTSIARFVLEESEGLRDVSNDFYRLLAFDLELDASESLLRYLVKWLEDISNFEPLPHTDARSRISHILFDYADLIRTTKKIDTLSDDFVPGPGSQTVNLLIESMKNGVDSVGGNIVRNWVEDLIKVLMLDAGELSDGLNELLTAHEF